MYTRRCRRHNYCYSMCNNMDNNANDYETMCNNVMNTCDDNDYDDCECGYEDDDNCCGDIFPISPMYAQSYVPFQYMNKTFKPCVGLKKGTIFPELVDPYCPGQSMEFNQFVQNTNTVGEGCNNR